MDIHIRQQYEVHTTMTEGESQRYRNQPMGKKLSAHAQRRFPEQQKLIQASKASANGRGDGEDDDEEDDG